jgi:hypothetical protein
MRSVVCLGAGVLFAIGTCCLGQTISPAGASAAPIVSYANIGSDMGRIAAFAVMTDGSVRSVPGSPFSEPSMFLNVSSGYLFASDGRFIVTYTRAQNGSLRLTSQIDGTQHNDTPQGSGIDSLTLDRSGASLYAGEINFQGADNDAYAFFGIGRDGRLRFIANSPINVNFHGSLGFSQNDKYAYGDGCFFIGWDLFGLVRSADGRLTPFDPKASFPPNPKGDILCPGAMAASAKGYLVLNYSDLDAASQHLVTYRINPDGSLTIVSHSAFTTQSTGFSSIRLDPSGTFLAAAGRNGLRIYRLLVNGRLAPVGAPVATAVNFGAVQWDNFGHVFALSSNGFYIFDLNHGVLMPAPGSPHPIAKSASLAVLPVR